MARTAERIAAAGLLALASCSGGVARPEGLPPDVVVMLVDTLRADWLGAYGHPEDTSPNLDALAAESVVFEQASAPAPWTLPSVVSLHTARFPLEHGVVVDGLRLAGDVPTLAEVLRDAGWRTASFYRNPYAGPIAGLDRGFDEHAQVEEQVYGHVVGPWLDRLGAEPFFLYLHNTEPHDPHLLPIDWFERFGTVRPEERRRAAALADRYRRATRADWVRGRPLGSTDNAAEQRALLEDLDAMAPALRTMYSAAVYDADHHVGGIVEALRDAGRWEDTLFVFLADHGEEMGEHGGWQHDQSVYEELIRVPLLVRLPGARRGGRRVAEPVSLVDVAPTVLDALGLDAPAGLSGRSLLPWIEGRATSGGPRVVATRVNRKKHYRPWHEARGDLNLVVRDGPWKGILNAERDTFELYDLARDPAETADRSAEEPELARRLRELAARRLRELSERGSGAVGSDEPLPPEARRALEQLGYLSSDE